MASGRLRLDHTERMRALGGEVSFGNFDQILQLFISSVWQGPAFPWLHRYLEFLRITRRHRPLGDALVAGVSVNHLIIAIQQLFSLCEDVHVGGGDYYYGMDLICILIYAFVVLHPKMQLEACRE